jgi:large subunit ribosomal protein L25
MTDILHVEKREKKGSAHSRRLRATGKIAAVLYGHGEPNVNLSVPVSEVDLLLRHHGRTVQLAGGADGHALVKSVQWDGMGVEVLHLDFYRVSLDEDVEISVGVILKGDPPGLSSNGVMNHAMYEVMIRCKAGAIPESLSLSVSDLQIGQQKLASDIILPEGATLLTPKDAVVVSIELRKEQEELVTPVAEPELIKKPPKPDAKE